MHAHPRAVLAMAAALTAFTALSTVATPARAAFQLSNVGLQCSDSLVVQEGDAYVLSCTGDLSVQGLGGQGSFIADTSITLNATGSLSLLDVLLQAPNIVLHGGADLKLLGSQTGLVGTGVSLSAGGVIELGGFIDTRGDGTAGGTLSTLGGTSPREGGGIVVSGGSVLGSNDPKFGDVNLPTLGSAVPEASSFAMMASGLVALVGLLGVARRNRP